MIDPNTYKPSHFRWEFQDPIGIVTLDRPARKNPLTFESYAELRDTFLALAGCPGVRTVILCGAGGNFCSGGDVRDIIGPLTRMDTAGLLAFTRLTGSLVQAMIACPQLVIAAIDGVCVGAGAAMAMASDIRFGTADATVAFLFTRAGLAGCDMGACAMLPRIVGHGRAAELLYTGRNMHGEEAERWGFFNRLCTPEDLMQESLAAARQLSDGPRFAQAMTKRMLFQEWNMGLEQFIEAEAQAQALCMQQEDFRKAYAAFIKGEKPVFRDA